MRSIDVLFEGETCTVTGSAANAPYSRTGDFTAAFYGALAWAHGSGDAVVVRAHGELNGHEADIRSAVAYFNASGNQGRFESQRPPVAAEISTHGTGYRIF